MGRNWKRAQPQGPAPRQFLTRQRDYQELKQEVGLGHYEGRRWRGFHHHATLCIAAYGFLIAERATIPPSGARSAALFKTTHLPENYRPRGSALAA
jgi:SRSO17 transposase